MVKKGDVYFKMGLEFPNDIRTVFILENPKDAFVKSMSIVKYKDYIEVEHKKYSSLLDNTWDNIKNAPRMLRQSYIQQLFTNKVDKL